MNFKSSFLKTLSERGFLNNCSSYEELDEIMSTSSISAYIGFDCTAKSLHVGSLMQILILRYLQQNGHTPVILLGGGTSLIGDPSFKDESRKLLSKDDIEVNLQGIKSVLERFVSFEGKNAAIVVNNYDWLSKFNYLEFLRDYGVHFTVNRMLSFDSVKLRLDREQPLSFLEFNYMLLQAVDFYHLRTNMNTILQIGGSDQWGNIINGVEIIRRKDNIPAYGLTTNLLTKSDGSKMGKTASGAVWLTKEMFSTWDFYQYFRNTPDENVIEYLKIFTEVSIAQIEELSKLQGKDINKAKQILAYEVTKVCHGKEEAQKCQQMAINTFENKVLDTNLPSFDITDSELSDIPVLPIVIKNYNLTQSNSEARKLISQGGIKLNDIACNDMNYIIKKSDFEDDILKISVGKKKHVLIKLV